MIPRARADRRSSAAGVAAAAVAASFLGICGCSAGRSIFPRPLRQGSTSMRIPLDPELAPVPYRWLADDAVLVAPKVGERKLAAFGNYVERAASPLPRARLSVWDDESAWKVAAAGKGGADVLAHKRAEYVKEPAPPDAVDRYTVFGRSGRLVYQRDFRAYPLSELD